MGIESRLPDGILLTSAEKLLGIARAGSLFPATFGLACCAIEMMSTGAAHYDLARFGMEVFRASPRQADLMIVAGRVSQKMAPIVRNLYDQMADPKWVISMGVCASSGGMFNNYAIVQGVDHIIPVDMYVPGCPPRPELLMDGILKLHEKIRNEQLVERPRKGESMADFRKRTGWVDGETIEDPGRVTGSPDMTAPALHRIMPKETVAGGGHTKAEGVQRRQEQIAAGKPGSSWAR
ncbi:NADH-ubiquinone oxidoreductase chain B [Euzebya pacifica]|uniref:NADH-quinone oxidoreductase subunit B n=1 Tax=Euzebya pacifica TaxID=1608957 RepID=A0A346Y425_9ACTN|nr:NADH-ubiquinone oxidoreductase chain B [Euzebya pacifica]